MLNQEMNDGLRQVTAHILKLDPSFIHVNPFKVKRGKKMYVIYSDKTRKNITGVFTQKQLDKLTSKELIVIHHCYPETIRMPGVVTSPNILLKFDVTIKAEEYHRIFSLVKKKDMRLLRKNAGISMSNAAWCSQS